ncbi:MAG TPA: serine/threonine-protein kinase [Vicinamibacteria bacterium]|nr:serine/threonine-protein kinase [Vicinamibacteria bacterium]
MVSPGAAPSGEEARAFLQERLAFVGLAAAGLALGFYVLGGGVSALATPYGWRVAWLAPARLIVLGNAIVGTFTWWTCRRGRRAEPALVVLDGALVLLVTLLNALMVFARFPGEVAGLSYARAMLLVTFGLVFRAIVVPSTARRTLLLGLAASAFPIAASSVWHLRETGTALLPAVWTALWCGGAVAIATLASRSIFGLRQQVREAWQLGQYTLREKIGEGGMGTVYRASHAMLRRPTAVKLLPPGESGAERLQRFEREVQLTSRLTHPNTVAIFDYGRTPDGVFYYAMEYLEGLNLEDLARHDGPQPAGRVVHVLRQVAGSLAEAHEVGLIHRDVKPANVILVAQRGGSSDVAKVVDFGLVKDLDQATDLSRDDHIAGTPLYLAPEAITAPGRVGARADLYSLGCVGYYLLTGRPVFEGRNVVEVCGHHLHSRPVPPSERLGQPVPDGLQALLLSCLEKEPSRRPSFAGEFLETLDALRDVPPWTNEQARGWWGTRGPLITARVRAAARGGRAPARAQDSGLGTVSFVRRVDVRRRA